MEDRKLPPECAEEVIDLLDIVDSGKLAAQIGESADLVREEMTAGTMTDDVVVLKEEDIVSTEDEALELTDVVEAPANEVLDLTELADPLEIAAGEPECAEADADAHPMPELSEDEEKGEEAVTVMDVFSEEGALQQTPAESDAADIEAVLALVSELDERIGHQEKTQDTLFQALEDRLAASEKRCAELEGRLEELQHQLAGCSSMFLGDAGVRLTLEEMVSRMIEARMPASPDEACTEPVAPVETSVVEEEMPESSLEENAIPIVSEEESEAYSAEDAIEKDDVSESVSADEEVEADTPEADVADQISVEESAPVENGEETLSQQVIIDTIEELAQHLIELEERVNGWEVRCEQEAALAAARVIREEIAALRAGAARMGR